VVVVFYGTLYADVISDGLCIDSVQKVQSYWGTVGRERMGLQCCEFGGGERCFAESGGFGLGRKKKTKDTFCIIYTCLDVGSFPSPPHWHTACCCPDVCVYSDESDVLHQTD
jgi:hypothetical protein